MNAYEKSVALGLRGTPTEVEILNSLTLQAIPLDLLLPVLNFRRMLRKTDGNDGSEKWQGSIIVMKGLLVAAAVPPENATEEQLAMAAAAADAVVEIDTWFSHITNPRNVTWDTTQPAYAVAFAALRTQFAESGIFQNGDFEAIYELGGGTYSTTLEELESLQATAEAAAAAAAAAAAVAAAKALLITFAQECKTEFDAAYNLTLRDINNGQITTEAGVNDSLGVVVNG